MARAWSPFTGIEDLPEAIPLVFLARLTCSCAGHDGGVIALSGSRVGADIYADCEHAFDLIYWMELPPMPREIMN